MSTAGGSSDDFEIVTTIAEIKRIQSRIDRLSKAPFTPDRDAEIDRLGNDRIGLEVKLLTLRASVADNILAKLDTLHLPSEWREWEHVEAQRYRLGPEALLVSIRRDIERLVEDDRAAARESRGPLQTVSGKVQAGQDREPFDLFEDRISELGEAIQSVLALANLGGTHEKIDSIDSILRTIVRTLWAVEEDLQTVYGQLRHRYLWPGEQAVVPPRPEARPA